MKKTADTGLLLAGVFLLILSVICLIISPYKLTYLEYRQTDQARILSVSRFGQTVDALSCADKDGSIPFEILEGLTLEEFSGEQIPVKATLYGQSGKVLAEMTANESENGLHFHIPFAARMSKPGGCYIIFEDQDGNDIELRGGFSCTWTGGAKECFWPGLCAFGIIFFIIYLLRAGFLLVGKKHICTDAFAMGMVLAAMSFAVMSVMASEMRPTLMDENDNIIAGMLQTGRGAVIYKDYVSQHMPLVYWMCGLMSLLGARSVGQFRLIFEIIVSIVWGLVYFRHRNQRYGRAIILFAVFSIPVALTFIKHNAGQILSDNVQAVAMTVLLLELMAYYEDHRMDIGRCLVISVCIFASVGAAFLAVYAVFACGIAFVMEEIRYHLNGSGKRWEETHGSLNGSGKRPEEAHGSLNGSGKCPEEVYGHASDGGRKPAEEISYKTTGAVRAEKRKASYYIRRYTLLAVCVILPWAAAIGYLASKGALRDAYDMAFRFNVEVYPKYGLPGANALEPLYSGVINCVKLVQECREGLKAGTAIPARVTESGMLLIAAALLVTDIFRRGLVQTVGIFFFIETQATRQAVQFHSIMLWYVVFMYILIELPGMKRAKCAGWNKEEIPLPGESDVRFGGVKTAGRSKEEMPLPGASAVRFGDGVKTAGWSPGKTLSAGLPLIYIAVVFAVFGLPYLQYSRDVVRYRIAPVPVLERTAVDMTEPGDEIFIEGGLLKTDYIVYKERYPATRLCWTLPWYYEWYGSETVEVLKDKKPKVMLYQMNPAVWEITDFATDMDALVMSEYTRVGELELFERKERAS